MAEGKIVVSVEPKHRDRAEKFIEKRKNDIAEINLSIEKGDYPSIQMIGELMKKTADQVGLTAVKEYGQTLETAAKIKDSGKIKELVKEIGDYFSKMELA